MRLRDDFSLLKGEILEWGEVVCSIPQASDAIESKYNAFLGSIEQKISEVLLTRGDLSLVGELASLRDRLNMFRKRAQRVSKECQGVNPLPEERVPVRESGEEYRDLIMRSCELDYVFHDLEPMERTAVSAPSYRGGGAKRIPTQECGAMAGLGSVQSGPEPVRPVENMGLQPHNTSKERRIDARREANPRSSEGVPGVGGVRSVQSEPAHPSLNTPRFTQPGVIPSGRILSMNTSESLEEIISRISEEDRGSDDRGDQQSKMMMHRQTLVEEKINKMYEGMNKFSTALHGAEAMFQELREDVDVLKSNTSEVWEKLKTDEQRLSQIESCVLQLDEKLDRKVEMIQEWFVDMSTRATPEVPAEIVNSIREVIADSSPGLAVNRMRAELEEIRDSVSSNQHVAESLRTLVVDLSDQVINNSMNSTLREPVVTEKDARYNESCLREKDVVKKSIERAKKQLEQIVSVELRMETLDISLIKKHKTVDVPAVHSTVGGIQKSLQKYVTFPGAEYEYCDEINEILDRAENWCSRVEEMYNKAEVHSINTSKGDSADVGIFSDNAKVTIYEFLEAAEIAYLGWGNSKQKANRLYNRHLSEEIKNKLINMSDSYPEMKNWLISNYGGVSRIISDIINDLSRKGKPGSGNNAQRFTFYAYICGALQRMERLSKVGGIDKAELENCVYSRATLNGLSLVLPPDTYADWITEMTRAGLDYKNPVGEIAYQVFKNLCIIERNKSEGSREPERLNKPKSPNSPRSPRNKGKSAHKVTESKDSNGEEESHSSAFTTKISNPKWYRAGLKFPCPLTNHQHEMSTCAEFFSLSPGDRWNKMEKGKICYACLAPKDVCVNRRCSFEAKVPESLKCQGCASWAQSKNLAPLSVLFCRRKEHAELRSPFPELKKDLESYIGKLGTMIVDSSVRFAANYTYQVFSMGPGVSAVGWDQEQFKDKPAPSVDSETGRICMVNPEKIIPEVGEHSCYLMQTIKIGSSEALIFFDRGANIHIIDGELAKREGLQKVSSVPTNLTVVGGNKVRSNHGTFRFNLGPGDKGEYHEVVCVGMDNVTEGFGDYDLSEICQEFKEQATGEEEDQALPKKVGGSKVHLLLGIKNTNLDPVLIKVLPSGIAVYLSPFRDIYGSRLIFAGPHKSFTKKDDGKNTLMSNAVFLIREKMMEELEVEPEERCYSIRVNEKLGLTVNPYPISKEDIEDCCGEIAEDFEDSMDDHEKLVSMLDYQENYCMEHCKTKRVNAFMHHMKEECSSLLSESYMAKEKDQGNKSGSANGYADECNSPNREPVAAVNEGQGVFKARIPIARLRNAVDDEDSGDIGGFRCTECSKCLTCKTSSKRTAISLREAREQRLIEDSVGIDLIQKRVTVNYPFLKDPVVFFILGT